MNKYRPENEEMSKETKEIDGSWSVIFHWCIVLFLH